MRFVSQFDGNVIAVDERGLYIRSDLRHAACREKANGRTKTCMSDHAGEIEVVLMAITLCVIGFSLLTGLLARTILTLPIVFVGVGFLLSVPLQHAASPETLSSTSRILAEITLVLLLFSDASHVRFSRLKSNFQIPMRMLAIAMPLSLMLGTVVVYLINPLPGLAMALMTAAVLTPTDAAVGQAVVTSPNVPEKLSQSINVESGLNDGLALPFVLMGAILASGSTGHQSIDDLPFAVLIQITLGPLVGAILGWILAWTLSLAIKRDWIIESAQGVVFLASAFAAYLIAELVGGNGFIAAFVAGAVFGNRYKYDLHFISEFMEGNGQLLTMAAFLMFGALLLPQGLVHFSVIPVIVALLFLTVVRMLPIWLSLSGTGLSLKEKLFLGWFGPRGLASILFTLIIIDEFDFPGEDELLACVSVTVFFSILLHGITATPLANRIAQTELKKN